MMSRARLLIVDDDASGRRWVGKLLLKDGYEVDVAGDGEDALRLVAERAPALIITDLNMPRMGGMDLLQRVRQQSPEIALIVVTGQDRVASAVAAMRAGAQDYLTKPLDVEALRLSIERTLAHRALVSEAENLRRHLRERDSAGLSELIGTSAPMQRVYRVARQVAPSRASVVIRGEAGTGRSDLARAIHALSGRSGRFVAVECSGSSEQTLERELFGDQREPDHSSRIEQAARGTLFLGEVSSLPVALQGRLLNLCQTQSFERAGGSEAVPADVRLITSTRCDLAQEVREGRFREDLYYRLNVAVVELPPLRLRGTDVLLLAEHFLARFARESQRAIEGFSEEARRKLSQHHWPGNVRELESTMERAVLFTEGNLVQVDALPFETSPAIEGLRIPGSTLAEVEKLVILKTFEAANGSTARAAEILDVSVRTIQYRLQEYGVPTRRARS